MSTWYKYICPTFKCTSIYIWKIKLISPVLYTCNEEHRNILDLMFSQRWLFVRGWVDSRAIVRLEGLAKLKKSTSSGTRTGDLPAYSIVPQPTTLPRAEEDDDSIKIYLREWGLMMRTGLCCLGLESINDRLVTCYLTVEFNLTRGFLDQLNKCGILKETSASWHRF
jgi:hypothetical protein